MFEITQKALAGLYKLVTIISVKEALNVEGDEGVDVRILLLAWPRNGSSESEEEQYGGAVAGIADLARSRRWNEAVGVQSEEGEELLKTFVKLGGAEGNVNVKRIRGGIVQVDGPREDGFVIAEQVKRHFSVLNGGTFDHLHIGHKLLLTMTAFMLDRVPEEVQDKKGYITIGITAEDLLKKKKYAEFLESWSDRQKAVHRYLKGVMCFDGPGETIEDTKERHNPGPNGHVVEVEFPGNIAMMYTEIWDPFGPSITDEEISALIVSEETRKGGQEVNVKRKEIGFSPLEVFEVDVLDSEEIGDEQERADGAEKQFLSKLSSTEIRRARSERGGGNSKV